MLILNKIIEAIVRWINTNKEDTKCILVFMFLDFFL